MSVSLSLTEAQVRSLLNEFTDHKAKLEADLAVVNENIATLNAALRPFPRKTTVLSSDASHLYEVTAYGANDFECTCPSYRFMAGLDSEGRCKHIRKALDEGRFNA